MAAERKPHFFKVLLGGFAQKLKIPPRFMKHIPGGASTQRGSLQGPNGNSWEIELRKTSEGTFLSGGWVKFVEDNSLKECQFVVFQYEGDLNFSAMVFDKSACEREDLFEIESGKKSSPLHEGKKRKVEQPKLHSTAKCATDKFQERRSSSSKPSGDAKTKMGGNEQPIHTIHQNSFHRKFSSRRRPVTEEERLSAQEAAKSFSSVFPCTILCMTEVTCYKATMLTLPIGFSRTHLPSTKTNMILRDPRGKAWVVVYIPGAKKTFLSGGWSNFVSGNNLEEGDVCAFELIGPVELRVHIFRVVEEITPLVRIFGKVLYTI